MAEKVSDETVFGKLRMLSLDKLKQFSIKLRALEEQNEAEMESEGKSKVVMEAEEENEEAMNLLMAPLEESVYVSGKEASKGYLLKESEGTQLKEKYEGLQKAYEKLQKEHEAVKAELGICLEELIETYKIIAKELDKERTVIHKRFTELLKKIRSSKRLSTEELKLSAPAPYKAAVFIYLIS